MANHCNRTLTVITVFQACKNTKNFHTKLNFFRIFAFSK